ncbi:unnamed protein product [Rhizoctonia solani]|uniref:Laminin domain protein n=2 Tax=Rhizoctonia solani TaxID=456999 RepID=A0A8H3GP47_9AGAM|nr:putative laminin domain protein [Rhizoctonia solani 123E]CAE6459436.1 unnamed protein product [Rhizoctonia solani]
MAAQPGWYPPGQACYPPELPAYLRNVYELKAIVGVPSNDEVIGIHAVVQAARKASEIPGMHDPVLNMKLGDHLFSAQMAIYRSKYSLVTFPSDATYAPPVLPASLLLDLNPISGAPSDEELIKVQDAVQTYQESRRFPSMFDAHVNMELSQHLFDIQMARYMRLAGESLPSPIQQLIANVEDPARVIGQPLDTVNEATMPTNNAGTGANVPEVYQDPPLAHGSEMRDLMERSNQLAEKFNQLLGRSNELMEQHTSETLAERFNTVLERLTQPIEQSYQPNSQSEQRFNELFIRINQLVEQLEQSSKRSNELSEQANKSSEKLGNSLGDINTVLVEIQHAIIRNHKGNTYRAVDCLVNKKGETPGRSKATNYGTLAGLAFTFNQQSGCQLPIMIEGTQQLLHISDDWLGKFLRFYDLGEEYFESKTSTQLKEGCAGSARLVLAKYLNSCLG